MNLRRRSSLVLAAVLALCAPATPVRAQEAAATQALPSAREVIDRFAQVTNAKEVLAKHTSMRVRGRFEMQAMGMTGKMEAWSARPNKRFTTIEMGSFGKLVQGYDGQVGWMTQPMLGARVLEGPELLQFALEADFEAVLKTSDAYESLRTLGTETFEGKSCYKVEVVARPLPGMDAAKTREVRTSHEFYEVESGLLLGSKGYQESDMSSGPFTTVMEDYKDFGGGKLASKSTIKSSGQEFQIIIESVEYDTATDALFALPKEIQDVLASKAAKAAPPAPKPQ